MKEVLVKCKSESVPTSSSNSLHCIVSESQRRLCEIPRFKQDTSWSWVVCLCAALSNIVVVGLSYSYGVLYPALLDYFKEDKATTAWVGSLFMSVSFVVAPISATLCDQYGCRTTAIGGAFVCCLGLLLTSQAPSLYTMFLTYSIITGFGACCVYTACFITVPKYFTKSRSFAVGFVCLGPSAGVMLIAPLLQILLDTVGWRKALLALAAMAFLVCLFSCSFDSDTVKSLQLSASSLDSGAASERGPYGTMVRNKRYVVLVAASAIIFFGLYNPQMHLVKFCRTRGISDEDASMLFFYIGLASSVLRVVSGRLCDSPRVNDVMVFQSGIAFIGLAFMLLPWATSYTHMMAFALALGSFDGFSCTAGNLMILGSVHERHRGHAYGVWLTAVSVPIAIGPPIAGFMADKFDSYAPAFYMSGSAILLGVLCCSLAYCVHREPNRSEVSLATVETFDDHKLITEKMTVL